MERRFNRFLRVGLLPLVALSVACSDKSEETDVSEEPEAAATPAVSVVEEVARAPEPNVVNGEYVIGFAHCSGCHSTPENLHAGSPGFMAGNTFAFSFGTIHIPNITPDNETGIGLWSDEEIEISLREGRRPDGSQLHPLMPYPWLKFMSADDMRDSIAYLRSLPAVENALPRNVEVPMPAASFGTPPPLPSAEEVGEQVARGAYVTWLAHCLSCHTPATDGVSDFTNKLGAGGSPFEGPVPAIAANLTAHEEDGISHYSIEDIAGILKTGNRPDGTATAPIMGPRLETANQADLEAVAAYLKTLPPIPMPVEDTETGSE
jgi:mono/diheme cytochrome c family protein